MDICDYNHCTGCGACRQKCPKHCITMVPDELDSLYPKINENECISCGTCKRVCPNNRKINLNLPRSAYAAWSNDLTNRLKSASGGIATEIYNYCIKEGFYSVGVTWDRERGAYFIPIYNEDDIKRVRNSKYVFSDTDLIFQNIKTILSNNIPVVFIGLPCQVSGLYSFLGKSYEKLITIDLICHGVAPASYLEQHISAIEKKKKLYTKFLSFRDPDFQTSKYTFTLRNEDGRLFYKNKVRSYDNYQLGFHRSLIYRRNCYNCLYARHERVSDLTIGDFSGLGKLTPVNYDKNNVNCVLINTEKGELFLKRLGNKITLCERPIEEALKFEHQLQRPSEPHQYRTMFTYLYSSEKKFEKSCNSVLIKDKIRVFLRIGLWGYDLRRFLKVIIPHSVIIKLKSKSYK